MSVTIESLLELVGDYTAAETGNVNQPAQIRAIDKAVSYLQRKAGLPNQEKIHSFYYNDDQFFNDAPVDFMEELDIMYNNPDLNTADREWEFQEYSTLLKRTGNAPTTNKWSFTTINGTNQIVLIGNNENKGSVIDTLDTVGDWVASGDASGLTRDALQKKVGDASLSFDITYSTGLATLTRTGMSLSVQSLFENHGYFKLWTWLSNLNLDGVVIRLFVDNSNYWTMTATEYDDGSALAANAWHKIGWALDDAVQTGSPAITSTVTKIQIQFLVQADFGSAVDFRVDHLFTTIPDYMDLVYRSNYKGKNASGTSLVNFTAITDTIGICDLFPDIDDIIARRAALNLWPQLRADKEFYVSYQSEMKDFLRDSGMRFPRRRNSKYLSTRLKR